MGTLVLQASRGWGNDPFGTLLHNALMTAERCGRRSSNLRASTRAHGGSRPSSAASESRSSGSRRTAGAGSQRRRAPRRLFGFRLQQACARGRRNSSSLKEPLAFWFLRHRPALVARLRQKARSSAAFQTRDSASTTWFAITGVARREWCNSVTLPW